MPDACDNTIAHVSPFHRGLFDIFAWSHINCMVANHSNSDDVWIIHVGRDSALDGSICKADDGSGNDGDDNDDESDVDSGAVTVVNIPLSNQ